MGIKNLYVTIAAVSFFVATNSAIADVSQLVPPKASQDSSLNSSLEITSKAKKESLRSQDQVKPVDDIAGSKAVMKTALSAIYNLNANNVDHQLAEAKKFFTPDGWQRMVKALDVSGIVKGVQSKKFVVEVSFDDQLKFKVSLDPQSQGSTWFVNCPFKAIYKGKFEGEDIVEQQLDATALVKKIDGKYLIENIVITEVKVDPDAATDSPIKPLQNPEKQPLDSNSVSINAQSMEISDAGNQAKAGE